METILNQILSCNTDAPFIFISYSSKDKELVYRDVLWLQQHGYNVWLDEKKLDKTNASWTEDALEALEDMECSLALFYVSSHSLCSINCYREISHTSSDEVNETHFGDLKYLVIEAEPIDDIVAFAQDVYEKIKRSDLPKEQKQNRSKTLRHFVHDHFHDNNERVRIRYKDSYTDTLSYYRQIVAQLPEETNNLPQIHSVYAQAKPGDVFPGMHKSNGNADSVRQLMMFANMVSQNIKETDYVNPYLSDEMADIIADHTVDVKAYTAEQCLREEINPIIFEVFLAQKIARMNDPSNCVRSFQLVHSMPGNWRVFLNSEKKVVAYWVFIALKEEAYKSISTGQVNELDISLHDARFIDMPGVYKGYLLLCGTIAELRTPQVVNLLYSSWLKCVEDFASQGIFFGEIASMVGSAAGNSSLQNIGMQYYADYILGGKMYKYNMTRAWEVEFLRKHYPVLCQLYQKEFDM